jgi:hypothetical protein
MLPKNRLGRAMSSKLHVVGGPEHPHQAQQPVEYTLGQAPEWAGLPAPKPIAELKTRHRTTSEPDTEPAGDGSDPTTPTATKTTAKKTTAKKSTAKKSTAKKTTAKKTTAKKSTAKKSTAKKTTAKQPAAATESDEE